jgi:hypothetical protein
MTSYKAAECSRHPVTFGAHKPTSQRRRDGPTAADPVSTDEQLHNWWGPDSSCPSSPYKYAFRSSRIENTMCVHGNRLRMLTGITVVYCDGHRKHTHSHTQTYTVWGNVKDVTGIAVGTYTYHLVLKVCPSWSLMSYTPSHHLEEWRLLGCYSVWIL